MTDSKDDQQRLAAVEQKLKLLVSLGIAQTTLLIIILVLMLIGQVLPNWSTLIMFILIAGLVSYTFRKQLPSILGHVSRFIFNQLSSNQKSGSNKDIS